MNGVPLKWIYNYSNDYEQIKNVIEYHGSNLDLNAYKESHTAYRDYDRNVLWQVIDPRIGKLLIDKGILVNERIDYDSPLLFHARSGNMGILRIILESNMFEKNDIIRALKELNELRLESKNRYDDVREEICLILTQWDMLSSI
jgi:hypothetical protein